jgi:hypothetical protein
MSSVAELMQNAEQCFCMAERTRDRDVKASWSRLAETWLSLADQEANRCKRRRPSADPRADASRAA